MNVGGLLPINTIFSASFFRSQPYKYTINLVFAIHKNFQVSTGVSWNSLVCLGTHCLLFTIEKIDEDAEL